VRCSVGTGDQDRSHGRTFTEGFLNRHQSGKLRRIFRWNQVVRAVGIVSGRDRLEGHWHHGLAVSVEQGDHAEVVALVINQVQELPESLVGRQIVPYPGQVQDARLDGHRGPQIAELARHILRDLSREQHLVSLDRFAQGCLADADGGVAGDGERNGGDADREQRELRHQFHGALQVKASESRVKPSEPSKAQTDDCPRPGGDRPMMEVSFCK